MVFGISVSEELLLSDEYGALSALQCMVVWLPLGHAACTCKFVSWDVAVRICPPSPHTFQTLLDHLGPACTALDQSIPS